jgi:Lipopolysaccharide-assembly
MILMNNYPEQKNKIYIIIACCISFLAASCLHYTLKESSIPKEIKTIRINFIENRARLVDPQLGPQLTEKLRQKINNQTNRTLVQGENADYDITGTITDYSFTTAGIADNRAATSRLTITVHIKLLNRLDEKKNIEADVSRNFDFDANISTLQAAAQLNESILKNLTDEIFNRIFSNW